MTVDSSEALIIPLLFSFSRLTVTSKTIKVVVTGLPWNLPVVPCRVSTN